MNVALYCRVSTEEQVKRGLSMGDQMATLRAYADAHGYTVAGEYQDPGTSARKRYTRRQGLMSLLEDAKEGRFQLVLFTKLDRWVRSVRDYYQVQDILEAVGVGWQTTEEDYETVTASGRFKVNIMLSVAQDEADRTSERIKFTFEQKRARGESTNGRAPLGYKIERGRPVVDEETALAAKDLFQAYIETRSMVATVKHLREAWDIDRAYISVQRYLSDPIYKGEYLGTEVPALVSQEDWELVQSILGSRAPRNAQKNIYLFHGLLHCAECGRSMNSSIRHIHGKDYIYYRCPKQMVGACTHRHRVREDVLEEWLLTHLLDTAEKYDLSIRSEKKGPDPKAKAERIKGKMEKLKDLYLSDLIDREVYARDYETLKQELSAIELERPPKPIDLDGLRDSLHLYQELERPGKKEFWTRTLKEVLATNEDEFFVELR